MDQDQHSLEDLSDFISRCVTYYLELRKQSNLVFNLLIPMLNSEIITNPRLKKNLSRTNIEEIEQKFLLNKGDSEAESFFKANFQNSVSALLSRLWDNLHLLLH